MAKFCVYCGGPLNADGRCPKCAARGTAGRAVSPAPAAKPAVSRTASAPSDRSGAKKPARKGNGKKKKSPAPAIILITLLVLILAFVALCALQLFKVVNIPFMEKLLTSVGISCAPKQEKEGDDTEMDMDIEPTVVTDDVLEPPDIETKLNKLGTIQNAASAENAAACRSEAETVEAFTERGFTQFPITTEYLMDGSSEGETEAAADSSERHPYYETYYCTPDNVLWIITEINGRIFANPATYNQETGWSVPHIVSESKTYLYYDSMENTFYEILPDAEKLVVKTVTRIDAETLNALTAEEVDR